MSVDAFCFEVKEWDLLATMFEFVDANPNYDTSSFGKALSQFIVEFKYKRNHWMYLLKYALVIFSITALSLLAFTFSFDEGKNVDRCGFIVGLVLTIAFMDYQRPNTDHQTIFDQYVIACHLFLIAMTTITGVAPMITNEHTFDRCIFLVALAIFVGYHLGFLVLANYKHREELTKIHQTYNMDIERMVEDDDVTLNKMRADYTKPITNSASALAFVATKEMN